MTQFTKRLICYFVDHLWTCKAVEGIPPSEEETPTRADSARVIADKFYKYSRAYCKRCGLLYKLK